MTNEGQEIVNIGNSPSSIYYRDEALFDGVNPGNFDAGNASVFHNNYEKHGTTENAYINHRNRIIEEAKFFSKKIKEITEELSKKPKLTKEDINRCLNIVLFLVESCHNNYAFRRKVYVKFAYFLSFLSKIEGLEGLKYDIMGDGFDPLERNDYEKNKEMVSELISQIGGKIEDLSDELTPPKVAEEEVIEQRNKTSEDINGVLKLQNKVEDPSSEIKLIIEQGKTLTLNEILANCQKKGITYSQFSDYIKPYQKEVEEYINEKQDEVEDLYERKTSFSNTDNVKLLNIALDLIGKQENNPIFRQCIVIKRFWEELEIVFNNNAVKIGLLQRRGDIKNFIFQVNNNPRLQNKQKVLELIEKYENSI